MAEQKASSIDNCDSQLADCMQEDSELESQEDMEPAEDVMTASWVCLIFWNGGKLRWSKDHKECNIP